MDRTALLDRFRTGYDDVVDALAGVAPDELDRQPPDGWTARRSRTTSPTARRPLCPAAPADRRGHPTIFGYDEEEFARRLHYERPIEPSLAVLAGVRAASLQLLESLTDEEWQRTAPTRTPAHTPWPNGCGLRRPLARPRRPDPPRPPRRGVGLQREGNHQLPVGRSERPWTSFGVAQPECRPQVGDGHPGEQVAVLPVSHTL